MKYILMCRVLDDPPTRWHEIEYLGESNKDAESALEKRSHYARKFGVKLEYRIVHKG